MRSVIVTGPGTTDVVEVPVPAIGPQDVLLRMRACGICGSDALYIEYGVLPRLYHAEMQLAAEASRLGPAPAGAVLSGLNGAERETLTRR